MLGWQPYDVSKTKVVLQDHAGMSFILVMQSLVAGETLCGVPEQVLPNQLSWVTGTVTMVLSQVCVLQPVRNP